MNGERDHHVAGQPPKFSRYAQEFKRLDGTPSNWRDAQPGHVPPRVTTPDRRAASLEAWRSAPAVRREYERGLRNGWIGAMLFYGVASAVLILAFHALGFRP